MVETGTLAELRHLTRTTITAETRQVPTALVGGRVCTTWSSRARRVRFDVDTAELDAVMRPLVDRLVCWR